MLPVPGEIVVKSPAGRQRHLPLTGRQLAVLRMMAQGESTNGMARQLGLSPPTIRDHIRLILAKLNARNQKHAVAIAMREGLLR